MNRVVFGGLTQTGCTPVAPASPTFDPTVQCTPFDPADAKRLVATSGVLDPTVHLLTPNLSDMLRLAQFIQVEEKAGPSGSADTDRNIYEYVASSGSRNYTGYSNPRLDLILANARKSTSARSLRTLYHVAEQILVNDRPILFLYYPVRQAGVNLGVTGVQIRPDLTLRVAFAQYK